MSKILKYYCPNCGSRKLIMIQGVVRGYPVETITKSDGGHCMVETTGEEIDVNTNNVDYIYSYECGNCGNTLLMEDDIPVTEDDELVQWVKDNCEQE